MPLVAALKGADKREGVLGYRDEREAAFDVLGRIGAPAILPVCAALADSDWEVRTFAARMLGRAGDRRAVPALVTALEDRWDVGCAAAEALGKLGWQPPMDERGARYWALRGEIGKCAEIGAPALGVLIAAAVKGGSEQICQEAAQVLVKNGAQSVEPLLAALGSADPFVRRVAAEVLGKIGDARAVEPLIHRLQAKDVSDAAATALGALRDRRAVEPLIASLEDSHDATRAAAAEALAQIGDSSAVEPLIHRLQDKGDSVRLAATEALALIGDSSAIEPLIHRLQDKGDSIRVAAAKGLVSLYRSGNLDMQMRQRILSQRDSITERHIDRATDCGAHVDSGIGVDFPL